jgi:hypothetical protein
MIGEKCAAMILEDRGRLENRRGSPDVRAI